MRGQGENAAPEPVTIRLHGPEDEAGRRELERRAAEVWARHVLETLGAMRCPRRQKRELLRDIAKAAGGKEE